MNSTSKKSSRFSLQWLKRFVLSFGIVNGVILLNFLEPRQTVSCDCYIIVLTKMKLWTSRIRLEKTSFLLQHSSARSHTSLKTVEHIAILAGLSYHIHHIVQIWYLLTFRRPMNGGLRGQHFPSNDPIITAVKPALLVQISTSTDSCSSLAKMHS